MRHFGYEFIYGSNCVDKNTPLELKIPTSMNYICDRILENKLMDVYPDQLTVNHYQPGQGMLFFLLGKLLHTFI